MPTLAVNIDVGLAGTGLSTSLDVQVANLGAVATALQQLVAHPPDDIGDLVGGLATLPAPQISVGGDLPAALAAIQAALPTDLSSLTASLTATLDALKTTLSDDLVAALEAGLRPIIDVAALLQLDLTCDDPPGVRLQSAAGDPPVPDVLSGASATLDRLDAVLALFPTPFTIESLLGLLVTLSDIHDRDSFLPRHIPYLDDARNSLVTLLAWHAAPATILPGIKTTLEAVAAFVAGSVDTAFGTVAADIATTTGQLQTAALASIADGLVAALAPVPAAVRAPVPDQAAVTAAVNTVNGLLDQYDMVRAALHAGPLPALGPLGSRLTALPTALDIQVGHVAAVVGPAAPLPGVDPSEPVGPLEPSVATKVAGLVDPVVAWLHDLMTRLDLSSLAGPIGEITQTATDAIDAVDAQVVSLTAEVQHLFAQVEAALDQVDTQALADEVKAAIDAFKDELVDRMADLFAPVRQAVGQVVDTISDGIDELDPAAVVQALKDVVDLLASVLDDPAIADVKAALGTAEAAIRTVSFTPVTDEVVAALEDLTTALNAIDTSVLSPGLQLALTAAAALLPDDLSGLTGPLVADLGDLIDAPGGPVALVASLRAPVAALMEKVTGLEPVKLVGNTLSAPFQELLGEMEPFRPSSLLAPVQEELGRLKARLAANANPGLALQALEAPFQALLAGFDAIKPQDIVAPLQDALDQVVDAVVEAVPVDDLLGPVGLVLGAVQGVADLAHKAVAVLHRVQAILTTLVGGPALLDAWITSVLDEVGDLDTAPLQAAMAAVTAAVGTATAPALTSRAAAAVAPVVAGLDGPAGLDPRRRLAAVVQAHRNVAPPALDLTAFPALKTALDRLDPLHSGFGASFEALAAFRQVVADALAALTTALGEWDHCYFGPDGALACLGALDATPANLRAWVKEAVDTQVTPPVAALLALAAPAAAAVGLLAAPVTAVVTDLDAQLAGLLAGPASAGAVKAAVDRLVADLRALDLGFLADSLGDLFAHVRVKLQAIGPAALRPVVDKAFHAMLDSLDISQVLPAADVAQLDASYVALVGKLRALDPGKLLADVVQPLWDKKVLPLLEAVDVSKLFDAIIDVLQGLQGQLTVELARANDAYKAMKAAVPSLLPISISIDIDIGGVF